MTVHIRAWSWRRLSYVCSRCGLGWRRRQTCCLHEPLQISVSRDGNYFANVQRP